MKTVDYFSKTVNRSDKLSEKGEFIKYESPFREYSDTSKVSPGYGLVWGKDAKGKDDWLPVKLPWNQGDIVQIDELDLNGEANDPRRAPTYIIYYYIATFENRKYRFSTIYGNPYAANPS